ncbi:sigma-70 family RNA polymerase sigma factor [Polyangium aurulentum]|uniref:sigma-70 family RNA polymerase sigma factor n=1 Tax=Polyangium aurulentum TaxID=2567896 RepID=UPI0010AE89DD|nr:sigma-70 family RNA polymerase sigma factor [Polyangium aurulentum]UQA61641.1 sigma-70 family RNA polymerase sigma factor [Polyangium aurulentum]
MAALDDTVKELAREHGRYLFGLCYRLTGSSADAEDLVQETLLRALERPPARADEPMRPWLARVAVNLGCDLLRARKRRRYVGPWLPSPIEADEDDPALIEPRGTEGRYDLVESVSMAFLVALEALTPKQRAVLLLCDVFDYPVAEAASALGMSESNVKTTHHRARRALEAYDRARVPHTPEHVAKNREALGRLFAAMAIRDGQALHAMLDAEARQLSDGGGEFFAARVPILGRERVARFLLGVVKYRHPEQRYEMRMLNGLPAIVIEQPTEGKLAPRMVYQCDVGPDGSIRSLYAVLATRKLTAVRPIDSALR